MRLFAWFAKRAQPATVLSRDASKFNWCFHCEEASPADDGFWGVFCPYCGNGNSAPGDYLSWEQFQQHHPQYPVVPIDGERYPLTSDALRQELEAAQKETNG